MKHQETRVSGKSGISDLSASKASSGHTAHVHDPILVLCARGPLWSGPTHPDAPAPDTWSLSPLSRHIRYPLSFVPLLMVEPSFLFSARCSPLRLGFKSLTSESTPQWVICPCSCAHMWLHSVLRYCVGYLPKRISVISINSHGAWHITVCSYLSSHFHGIELSPWSVYSAKNKSPFHQVGHSRPLSLQHMNRSDTCLFQAHFPVHQLEAQDSKTW